jgi:hypothetical protein
MLHKYNTLNRSFARLVCSLRRVKFDLNTLTGRAEVYKIRPSTHYAHKVASELFLCFQIARSIRIHPLRKRPYICICARVLDFFYQGDPTCVQKGSMPGIGRWGPSLNARMRLSNQENTVVHCDGVTAVCPPDSCQQSDDPRCQFECCSAKG